MNHSTAKAFIARNARPLDCARWQFLFENGSPEAVLHYLAAYQNEDGGFGHALEADCWNPNSSPVQTWAATQILREVRLEDKDHPMVLGILRYLENTPDFDGHTWRGSTPSNDLYPHAPWWDYSPAGEANYNPTASLIGFLLRYASPGSAIHRTAQALLREAYDWFRAHCPLESMHTAACFVELFEDLSQCPQPGIDLAEFERLLHLQIDHVLTKDTRLWETEYVCKPSLLIHGRDSRFYQANKALCDYECRFLTQTQQPDGTWAVTWDWGCCPEQWSVSKNWWKSGLILQNMKFYRDMRG